MRYHARPDRAWYLIIQREDALEKIGRSDVFLVEDRVARYYFWARSLLLCLPVYMPFFLRDVV